LNKKEWLSKLFTTVAAPLTFYLSQSNDPTAVFDVGAEYLVQLNYLQAEQPQQSMLRPYAVQLKYIDGQGFTTSNGFQIGMQNPTITECVPDTVITQGVMPVEVFTAFFSIWAIFGSLMGLFYDFKTRKVLFYMDTLCPDWELICHMI
jgi:hypothetical protein